MVVFGDFTQLKKNLRCLVMVYPIHGDLILMMSVRALQVAVLSLTFFTLFKEDILPSKVNLTRIHTFTNLLKRLQIITIYQHMVVPGFIWLTRFHHLIEINYLSVIFTSMKFLSILWNEVAQDISVNIIRPFYPSMTLLGWVSV